MVTAGFMLMKTVELMCVIWLWFLYCTTNGSIVLGTTQTVYWVLQLRHCTSQPTPSSQAVSNSIQFYLASIIATRVTFGQVKLHKLYNIKHSITILYNNHTKPYKNIKYMDLLLKNHLQKTHSMYKMDAPIKIILVYFYLKPSDFFMAKGSLLYNLILPLITLFLKHDVLQGGTSKSFFLLVS
jgi:hypothetical protein